MLGHVSQINTKRVSLNIYIYIYILRVSSGEIWTCMEIFIQTCIEVCISSDDTLIV